MVTRPIPVDRETPFAWQELFFSTTDPKGRIVACNDVFVRVAGYPHDTLSGSAHNIVRHPDMPRGVFRLMWDRLGEGRSVAAYVKNMSADGAYYWVLAVAVPSPTGFLSVRLKPSTSMRHAAEGVYETVRAAEQDMERRGVPAPEVAVAGRDLLLRALGEAGYHDYWAWESAILPAEITARDDHLTGSPHDVGGSDPRLTRTHEDARGLFGMVRGYQEAGQTLEAASTEIRGLAEAIRRNAINGIIAASRLGSDGAPLAVVAQHMSRSADAIGLALAQLDADLAPTVEMLRRMVFRISVTRLQAEMALAASSDGGVDMADLAACIADSGERAVELTSDLRQRFTRIAGRVTGVERILSELRALSVCGRVETAAVRDDAGFGVLLATINEQIDAGATQADRLRTSAVTCTVDTGPFVTLRDHAWAVRDRFHVAA